MMKKIIILLAPFVLFGCIRGADNRKGDDNSEMKVTGPIIKKIDDVSKQIDIKDNIDKVGKEISDKIITSSNATKADLSGLLNTSISKVGEKVTGLETNLSELIKFSATMNTNLSSEIKAKIEATATLNSELKAEMKNMINLSNKMEARLEAITDIQIQLGKINTEAQAQVGLSNRIDKKVDELNQTFNSNAGRDVNMLPKQAVDIIIGGYENSAIIISLILGLASFVICMAYRYSRMRAENRFNAERDDRKFYHNLLIRALSQMDGSSAEVIECQLERGRDG
jgi:hypothetical protein